MCTNHLTAIVTSSSARPKYVDSLYASSTRQNRLFRVQIEDMNSQAQMSAAQQLAQGGGAGGVPGLENSGVGGEADDDDDDDIPDLEAPEEEGPVDETGVEPKDIDLVMAQVNCSRAKAVRVLKESGGDLINASTFAHTSFHLSSNLTANCCSHGGKRVILTLDIAKVIDFHHIYHPFQLHLWLCNTTILCWV
jgi:NACalpha-BTF3-like transcription factor